MLQTHSTYKLSTSEFLGKGIAYATQNGFSFACWRLPNTQDTWFLISTEEPKTGKIAIESSASGFCVSPFTNEHLNESLFFKADILYRLDNESITPIRTSDEFESRVAEQQSTINYYKSSEAYSDTTQSNYESAVTDAVNSIEHNHLKKVVISKTKSVRIPSNINWIEKFVQLTQNYPRAFVSFISSKKTGTWIGATPETLISINKENVFKTVALAGTQPAAEFDSTKQAVWTQKEIEEQALVSRYIIHCLKEIRLREFEDIGPKTVKAGNLFHLKTEFLVDLKEVNFPNLGSVMLELLHPTSAVCGMPKKKAQEFIRKHENHERGLYSGFLGPVNIDDESNLFVNLRCAQITKDQIIFYAGAGITEDSIPEKEWKETEDKCFTLEKTLLV